MGNMRDCEKRFVEILCDETKPDVTLFCKTISDVINSFSIETSQMINAIITNKTASKRMSTIAWYWIRTASEFYQKKESFYDERNKLAYKRCYELCESPTGSLLSNYTEDFNFTDFDYGIMTLEEKRKFEYIVSVYMVREHRTLQQIFTGFVFTYLTNTNSKFKLMTKEIGEYKLGYMMMI